MPFRSMATLESWLEEFQQLGYPVLGTMKVIQQDGDEGANTGLVAVELVHGAVASYIQPDSDGSPELVATMEARDDALTLDAESLLNVAAELSVISALCSFLQSKSDAFVGEDAL
jgi:hypothetical protein